MDLGYSDSVAPEEKASEEVYTPEDAIYTDEVSITDSAMLQEL